MLSAEKIDKNNNRKYVTIIIMSAVLVIIKTPFLLSISSFYQFLIDLFKLFILLIISVSK